MIRLLPILALVPALLGAAPPRVVCADIAPMCYVTDGVAKGFAYELGEELQRRLGEPQVIDVQPLARTIITLQTEKRVVSLWLGRIPERETSVQWIGRIFSEPFCVFTLQGRPTAATLEKARQLRMLGANIAAANKLAAEANGLTRIEAISSDDASGQKLLAERIDGWVTIPSAVHHFLDIHQLDRSKVVRGVKLMDFKAYLVASNDLEPEEVERWREALKALFRDGSYARILKRHRITPADQPQDLID